jgi:hypothetical protein
MKKTLLVVLPLLCASYLALSQERGKIPKSRIDAGGTQPCAAEVATYCGVPFDSSMPVVIEKCLRINKAQLSPRCLALLTSLDVSRKPFEEALMQDCEVDVKKECGCYSERALVLTCLLERMDKVSCSCRKAYDEVFAKMLKAKLEAISKSRKS